MRKIIHIFIISLPTLINHVTSCPPIYGNGCQIFPAEDEWNRPIDQDPVDYRSNCYVAAQLSGYNVHLDLGDTQLQYGIPYSLVSADQPKVPITYYRTFFFFFFFFFLLSSFFFSFSFSFFFFLLFFDYRYVIGFQFNEVCFYMNKTSKDSVIDVMKITMFDISYVFEHHTKELDSTYLSHNIIAMFSQGDLMVLFKKKKKKIQM